MPTFSWRSLCLLFCLLSATAAAQTPTRYWAGAAVSDRLVLLGVEGHFGIRDLFAPGASGRFDLAYQPRMPSMELAASVLSLPRPTASANVTFAAYGGGGIRSLVLFYPSTAVIFGLGGLGGVELRKSQFGVFLELDATFPIFGIGTEGTHLTPLLIPIPKLVLGLNYYF